MKTLSTKAILVIDMPKSCEECNYLGWATHDEDMRACMLLNGYFFNEEEVETKRSEVCPLKSMPSRKNNQESVMVGSIDMDIGYILGWNECIEEITGETE